MRGEKPVREMERDEFLWILDGISKRGGKTLGQVSQIVNNLRKKGRRTEAEEISIVVEAFRIMVEERKVTGEVRKIRVFRHEDDLGRQIEVEFFKCPKGCE